MAKSNKTFPNKNALSKLAIAIFCANSGMVISAPVLDKISDGNADISVLNPGTDTSTTIIDQTGNLATSTVTIDWTTFNVGEDQTVNFIQNASDVAINNIGTGGASEILGKINAGGTVFLSNSNGFVFGANSSINTGAFLATTSSINDNTINSIGLTDTGSTGSISIHKDASINANNQASGGYLAFISKDISIDSGSNGDNSNSGLHADNGEVLISNDVNSTIQLSGLNILFPTSALTGSVENKIDLTNADVSAKTVILSSNNLTDLLDSVINQPSSISAEHLIISANTLGGDITSGIKEIIDINSNNDLSISELTLEDKSIDGEISITDDIDFKEGVDLSLSSHAISLEGVELSGETSNLTLNTTDTSANTINLTDSHILASTVTMNSGNLTDLLNSVTSNTGPTSISAKHLIISGNTVGGDVTAGIKEIIDVNSNNNLNITNLTLEDKSSTGKISLTENIFIKDGSNLDLTSSEISFIAGNVFGSTSNLTLNSSNVEIGYFSDNFGGSTGLGSLNITSDQTIVKGNIKTINDISIEGDVNINRDEDLNISGLVTTKLLSESGSLNINGDLSFTGINNSLGKIYISTGGDDGVTLGQVSGFTEIDLNANKFVLNGNIGNDDTFLDTNSISLNNNNPDDDLYANIQINEDITLSAENISFDDFYFSSSNESTLNFDITNNGSLSLKNSSTFNGDTSEPASSTINNIGSINIKSSDLNSNIIISGDFNTNNFIVESGFNLSLAGDSEFLNIEKFDLSQTDLTGNYSLSIDGNGSDSSTASFQNITDINGIKLDKFTNIDFNGNISTKDQGLSVTADNINFTGISNNDISTEYLSNIIKNDNSGETTLIGNIQSTNTSSLIIDTSNSDIKLGSLEGFKQLSIIKDLEDNAKIELSGSISVSDDITFKNLGDITVSDDISISTSSTDISSAITLTNSKLLGSNNDVHKNITLTSKNIAIDEVTGNDIDINTTNLTLSNDITAAGTLSILSSNAADTVNATLKNDITLTGDVDFLSSSESKVNFKRVEGTTSAENKSLSIISSNDSMFLNTFDSDSQLSGLSITTTNTGDPIEAVFNTVIDDKGVEKIVLPTLTGTQGLSLLGNMKLDVGDAGYTFDTSSYNGNLNLSGVSITGAGILTFNTGEGELSLGDIGTNNLADIYFTDLDLKSTGKLNLHGELNISPGVAFDFSNFNTIELHTDLTLGSIDTPTEINFGSASINGTHDLTLYTNKLTLAKVGNNIALQDLNIIYTSEKEALNIDHAISVVGEVNIESSSLNLSNTISATGLNVNITTTADLIMSEDSVINANYGDITLTSTMGNIGIGKLVAGETVTVRSETGYLYNNIDDYLSNDDPSVNITSTNQNLFGLTNIGKSVASPIVINTQNGGTITAESTGTIYIANLANAKVNATGRFIDGSSGSETASTDAFTQFKLSSLNTTNLPTLSSNLGLISNLTWQVDDEESIRKIKSPTSAPSIYYSRNGWRLGHK